MKSSPLILASQSVRREQLLREAGYRFQIVVPSAAAECGVCSDTSPAELVAELAYRKAADVAGQLNQQPVGSQAVIIAADTVADCDGQILGKPRDEEHARRMLSQLSGRRHRVFTGVCLWPWTRGAREHDAADLQPRVQVDMTTLVMDTLDENQLEEYLASGQWIGKAGAFGYQDRLGWVHIVSGSKSNVVGLPMERLTDMLAELARETPPEN